MSVISKLDMYGIKHCSDRNIAFITAVTYWVFKCRDLTKSPANGMKTWEYLKTSIVNAAIASQGLNDYIERLCKLLVVPHLRPQIWFKIINSYNNYTNTDEEAKKGYFSHFVSWDTLIDIDKIDLSSIIDICLKYPHLVTTFVRIKNDEDKMTDDKYELYLDD